MMATAGLSALLPGTTEAVCHRCNSTRRHGCGDSGCVAGSQGAEGGAWLLCTACDNCTGCGVMRPCSFMACMALCISAAASRSCSHALQREGKQLGQEGVGSWSDTSEGAIRVVMLAAR